MINAIKILLETHDIDSITTKMIAEECDVSAVTFYRYFNDKYDLMKAYYQSNFEEIVSRMGTGSFKDSMTELFRFMKKNQSYFNQLIRQQSPDDFFTVFYESGMKGTVPATESHKGSALTKEERYGISFFMSGCTDMCQRWIRDGMNESPEYMAGIIYKCIPAFLMQYIPWENDLKTVL